MAWHRKLDLFYFAYFVIHVPVTLLIDSCLIVPLQWQCGLQQRIVQFHIAANHDFLLASLPLWLQVFGLIELTFQLPLFVYGAYKLYLRRRDVYPWLMLYGFNASLTTLVCLSYVILQGEAYGLSPWQVHQLFALYVPYLLIPLVMLIDLTQRVLTMIASKPKSD